MTKYRLIFSPEFAYDLNGTFEYISMALSNEEAAKSLMKEIDDSIVRLKDAPEIYSFCKEPLDSLGYRRIIVKNYIIVYSIDRTKRTVNLLRCFYGKQNYLNFFE